MSASVLARLSRLGIALLFSFHSLASFAAVSADSSGETPSLPEEDVQISGSGNQDEYRTELRVPVSLKLATSPQDIDFTLTKFILISDDGAATQQGWNSRVDTGGFVAFAIEPVWVEGTSPNDPVRSSASVRPDFPNIVWRGLEVRIPGSRNHRVHIEDAGHAGFHWQLNLLLERPVFEAYWKLEERWSRLAADSRTLDLRVTPDMQASVVLQRPVHLEDEAVGDYTMSPALIRTGIESFAGASRSLVLIRDSATMADLIQHLRESGAIVGPAGTDRERTLSTTAASALFARIREALLEYALAPDTAGGFSILAARLRPQPEDASTRMMNVRINRQTTIDVPFILPVNPASAVPDLRTRQPPALPRVSEVKLLFWPWGNWEVHDVQRVKMYCETRARESGVTLDFRTTDVPTRSEPTEIVLQNRSNDRSELRCKPLGYWRLGKFIPSHASAWIEDQVAERQHFFFVLPEQAGLHDAERDPGNSGAQTDPPAPAAVAIPQAAEAPQPSMQR